MLMDASALVDLFVPSENDARIRSYLQHQLQTPMVSDLAAGEFAAALKRRVLMKLMGRQEAVDMLTRFDTWCASNTKPIATEAVDIRLAAVFVRHLDMPLRMPDALHLAQAHRLGVALCSSDIEQLKAAKRLGVKVIEIP